MQLWRFQSYPYAWTNPLTVYRKKQTPRSGNQLAKNALIRKHSPNSSWHVGCSHVESAFFWALGTLPHCLTLRGRIRFKYSNDFYPTRMFSNNLQDFLMFLTVSRSLFFELSCSIWPLKNRHIPCGYQCLFERFYEHI